MQAAQTATLKAIVGEHVVKVVIKMSLVSLYSNFLRNNRTQC